MKRIVLVFLALLLFCSCGNRHVRWSDAKANAWYDEQPWISGCDFIPSNAINQLEMWQADTFDPETLDRELGWAEELGFNCMRVFLHHLAWEQDRDGFIARMNRYLDISSGHGIKTMFVFLDDCWEVTATVGKQPEPRKGVHNSGWLADPGALYFAKDCHGYASDTTAIVNELEKYVKDVLGVFKNDSRVYSWDLYNEPGGGPGHSYMYLSMPLLKDIFRWSREVGPSQPITAGIWSNALGEMNVWQITHSDIVTYHTYQPLESHTALLDSLSRYGRPMVCTEYMARPLNSTFQSIMPMLRESRVGAINWGFVTGKTNTRFPWESPEGAEGPELWFHDILHPDGTPYIPEETECIKAVNATR